MIAVTTLCYAIGKFLGPAEGNRLVHEMIAGRHAAGLPLPECVQFVGSLTRIAAGEQVPVYVDTGGSHIGKARCRSFHWVRELMTEREGCDIWISVDDDCTANDEAIRGLVAELRTDTPRAIAIPCALRNNDSSPILSAEGGAQSRLCNAVRPVLDPGRMAGERVRVIDWAGFGIVGLNRAAVRSIVQQPPDSTLSRRFIDVDGKEKMAVFADVFEHTTWWGEDASFWLRLPSDVQRLALCAGKSYHAGVEFDCAAF